jgi:hypothetical protein
MAQHILVEDSLDWVKSRKLIVLVSMTPLLSSLLEPLLFFLFTPWPEAGGPTASGFVIGVFPRLALAHFLWKALLPQSNNLSQEEATKQFRKKGYRVWLLWSLATCLLILLITILAQEPGGDFVLILFAIQAGVGYIVVLFHSKLFTRVYKVREAPSHDAKAGLYFALLQWLCYMELYLSVFALFTLSFITPPLVLWFFAVIFCVLLIRSEPARVDQLQALQEGKLDGYQLQPAQEVKLSPDLQLYPLVAGLSPDESKGVVSRKLVLSGDTPFRSSAESMEPVALCSMDIEPARTLIQKRIRASTLLLCLHLLVVVILGLILL